MLAAAPPLPWHMCCTCSRLAHTPCASWRRPVYLPPPFMYNPCHASWWGMALFEGRPAPPASSIRAQGRILFFFLSITHARPLLDRRGAATAADLVLTWQRHCLTRKTADKVGLWWL